MNWDPRIFDSLLEPTFLVDAKGEVIYANEPAAIICETPLRRILRQKPRFLDLFKFEESVQAFQFLEAVIEPTPYQELVFHSNQGTRGKVQLTVQRFQENQWLVFFRDVTLEERLQRKYKAELEQKEGYIQELQKAQAELKKYSESLEQMVAERTQEIRELNRLMKALLDSLAQGFFVFDNQGKVLPVSSKACEDLLERNPQGQSVWDVLSLPAQSVDGFQKWMQTVFSEMLPFEDLKPLGPRLYPHSQSRHIALDYFPMRNDGQMEAVVVVATDMSDLIAAQKEADHERATARMIVNMVKAQRHAQGFVRESVSQLESLRREISSPQPSTNEIFRALHTLKGGSATFSVPVLPELCHEAENLLPQVPSNAAPFGPAWQALVEKISEIELCFENFLKDNEAILGKSEQWKDRRIITPASKVLAFDEKWLRSQPERENIRQEFLQNFWLEPIEKIFQHFDLVIQKTALELGKKVSGLIFQGPPLLVDPEAYEPLMASLVHAFRNAVDHGIELPEIREGRGKDPEGKIQVSWQLIEGDNRKRLRFCIEDDGGGIDPEAIRKKIESKGQKIEGQDPKQLLQRIFDPQFSTRDSATDISGRGVGLDAVQTEAQRMKGSAWVESQLGLGSRIFVEVPLLQVPQGSEFAPEPESGTPPTDLGSVRKPKIKSLAS